MVSPDVSLDGGFGTGPEVRALEQAFRRAVGKRALLLLNSFPFLIIGTLREAAGGLVRVEAETTHITELEGRPIWVRLDAVEVFYIEDDRYPIPRIGAGPASS